MESGQNRSNRSISTLSRMTFEMVQVTSPDQKEELRELSKLFTGYVNSLPIDMSFQNWLKDEIDNPLAQFAPPQAALFLAIRPRQSPSDPFIGMGCIGLDPIKIDVGMEAIEVKRLYVHPEFRREGVGKTLLRKAVETAKEKGYDAACLGTLRALIEAGKLYDSEGWEDMDKPLYQVPGQTPRWLMKRL